MIKILAVDNEALALEGLRRTILEAVPDAEVICCADPVEALQTALEQRPDIAFLDIEMPQMNGITLAKRIKEQVDPKTNIIFTTGYNEYVEEAFITLRVSGYLMKPITKEMIETELENLRYPMEPKGKKRFRVRAFGAFEIFIDDVPVSFHYRKTKELCAYLIDRGGMCTTAELQEGLWEDADGIADHSSYLQNMISDMTRTFAEKGCRDVVLRKYGEIGLDQAKLDCDYYAYRDGNPAAIGAFRGEYMSQYSWAEKTLGGLMFGKAR